MAGNTCNGGKASGPSIAAKPGLHRANINRDLNFMKAWGIVADLT
jgi:biotin operon repressor